MDYQWELKQSSNVFVVGCSTSLRRKTWRIATSTQLHVSYKSNWRPAKRYLLFIGVCCQDSVCLRCTNNILQTTHCSVFFPGKERSITSRFKLNEHLKAWTDSRWVWKFRCPLVPFVCHFYNKRNSTGFFFKTFLQCMHIITATIIQTTQIPISNVWQQEASEVTIKCSSRGQFS